MDTTAELKKYGHNCRVGKKYGHNCRVGKNMDKTRELKKKILMNYKRVEQIHQDWKNIGEENTAELNKACFNVVVYMGGFPDGLIDRNAVLSR